MIRPVVVLYNPQAVFHTMPLALLAVGSELDRDRFDVRIIDARLERDPHATLVDATRDALCLGVTVLTGAPIRDALAASRAVKAARPDLPVIWGGWHPSLFPLDVLDEPAVDVAVRGQGEITFAEVVDRLAGGDRLDGVLGATHRVVHVPAGQGTEVHTNPPRPLQDMDVFASANYQLVDVGSYFRAKGQRQLDYISSTGCRFRCAFCADPFVHQRGWVGLAPERVGQELEHLARRHGMDDVNFQDETFFTSPERVVAIAEQFLQRRLSFTWAGTLRADQAWRLDDDALGTCVRSGLRRVMVGVESGSQDMLDWMNKDITIEQVVDTAERCARWDIAAIFPFIVGFPDESAASVDATFGLVKRLRAMSPAFETPIFYFKPYPGSAITDAVVRAGHRLPERLEEWADFDYVGSSGPWVSEEKRRHVERFKFYNRFAGGQETWPRRPLQAVARWRCRHDEYRLPVEKAVVERLRPGPRLS